MKRNNRGISLIVLVITVIVMIILAGSVIISLSNSGIIGKANEAVDANNLKQVQQLATLAWSEAYIDKMQGKTVDLEGKVIEVLTNNKVDLDKYVVNVTDSGVSVIEKSTLGDLITNPTTDYGKLVDYVGVSFVDVTEWQVFYEDEKNGYVFLIAKNSIRETNLMDWQGYTLTTEQTNLYNIFKLGQAGYTLSNTYANSGVVAGLVSSVDYSDFANAARYGEYVIGVIGGPTIELLAAGYNAKYPNATTKITPIVDVTYNNGSTRGEYGYYINTKGTITVSGLTNDELYVPSNYYYWLASPSAENGGDGDCYMVIAGQGRVSATTYLGSAALRPVVCLKSTIPAIETEKGYSLLK